MNRKEKIKLLMQIAAGERNPKSLLPKKDEIWVKTTILQNGVPQIGSRYTCNGQTLAEADFQCYRRANPHRNVIIVHVLDTGIPPTRSEVEIKRNYRLS
ncbi:MAG: hypothetical protein EOO10_17720 [Chitinophagaceae bacterium]|nr:MAG: hypothetical protein EOO10_17720 [Chitinophagaceae bacterium]